VPQPLDAYLRYCGVLPADDKFTLDLDSTERKSRNRTYYTDREMYIVAQVCKSVPDLRTTVLAYQAGFLAYLEQLKTAFEKSKQGRLTDREKKRGMQVIDVLIRSWEQSNFSVDLLPAICLAYFKRDPSVQSAPLTEDFERGFAFAFRVGLFQNHVRGPDGVERHFYCPARLTIGDVATQALGQEVCGRPGQQFPMGRVMGSIYIAIRGGPQEIQQAKEEPERTSLEVGGFRDMAASL
jgi:hypothetical protein